MYVHESFSLVTGHGFHGIQGQAAGQRLVRALELREGFLQQQRPHLIARQLRVQGNTWKTEIQTV